MVEIILGILSIVLGLYCFIQGKIPLIKNYNGVKDVKKHVRLESGAIIFVGIIILFHAYFHFSSAMLMGMMIGVVVLCLILEVVLKAI
ncbi:MAG: hypothetical protein KHZ15_10285 [Coprobacillus cateniformis]|uniref:hypothetical protein n=1 Tax=Longibaculum muris TaxID=1796628 RepID=UPI003AB1D2B6|nr:hypothetical protein [Coprobacillus cateniformis]